MWKTVALIGLLGSPAASASIHRCTEWSDAGLRQKGDVILSFDDQKITWKAETYQTTATIVNSVAGASAFTDGNYIYIVFGTFGYDKFTNSIDLVRRIAMSRNSAVGEITCDG